jgi:hypothetical protein
LKGFVPEILGDFVPACDVQMAVGAQGHVVVVVQVEPFGISSEMGQLPADRRRTFVEFVPERNNDCFTSEFVSGFRNEVW